MKKRMNKVGCLKRIVSELTGKPIDEIKGHTICQMLDLIARESAGGCVATTGFKNLIAVKADGSLSVSDLKLKEPYMLQVWSETAGKVNISNSGTPFAQVALHDVIDASGNVVGKYGVEPITPNKDMSGANITLKAYDTDGTEITDVSGACNVQLTRGSTELPYRP